MPTREPTVIAEPVPPSNLTVTALVVLHAGIFFCAFPPLGFALAAWVCLVPLVILARDATARQLLLGTAVAFLLDGLLGCYWLASLSSAAWVAAAIGFGIYGLVFGGLAKLSRSSGVPMVLWFPAAWVAIELIRGKCFFFAFPWLWLGHSQVDIAPVIQIADVGGALAISTVVAIVNVFFATCLRRHGAMRFRFVRPGLVGSAFAIAIALGSYAYGIWRIRGLALVEGPRVLAVQSNFSPDFKDATERKPSVRLRRMQALTNDGVLDDPTGSAIDLIVWPETTIPVQHLTQGSLPYLGVDKSPDMRARMRSIVDRLPSPLLAGSLRAAVVDNAPHEFNSAVLFGRNGDMKLLYDKRFLAPLAEWTPLRERFPILHEAMRAILPPRFRHLERGRDSTVSRVGRYDIAPSICFDIAFSEGTNDAVRAGAVAVIHIANYAWFEGSAVRRHGRAQTILRSIETRRGIVSVVNGGTTHAVNALGQVTAISLDSSSEKLEGALSLSIASSDVESWFVRLPTDLFGWMLVIISILTAMIGFACSVGVLY